MSNATVYSAEKKIIETDERALLYDGRIESPMSAEGEPTNPVLEAVVGEKNYTDYLEQSVLVDELDDTTEKKMKRLDVNTGWYYHVLGRELATRSIEMSLLAGLELPDNHVLAENATRMTEGYAYDRIGRIRTNKPDIRGIKRLAKEEIENDQTTLGDLLAQERLYQTSVMMVDVALLTYEARRDPRVKILDKIGRGYGQREKDKRISLFRDSVVERDDGFASHERAFANDLLLLDNIDETVLSDQLREAIMSTRSVADVLRRMRSQSAAFYLDTQPQSEYHYFPSGIEYYKELQGPQPESNNGRTKSINRQSMSSEERAAALTRGEEERRLRQQAHEEQQRQERELQAEQEKHDAPILEHLNELAHEFNGIIDQYTAQTKRSLRDIGIFGKDSLDYWLQQSKCIDGTEVDHLVRVYARMNELAEEDDEKMVELLTQDLLRIEELKAEYATYRNEHALHGIEKPAKLQEDIKKQLELLAAEWAEFRRMIQASAHSNYTTPARLQAVAAMLGIEMPANETNKIEDEAPEEVSDNHASDVRATISPLQQANRLAEQLNWVVLPDEKITVDELVDIAEETIRRKSADKNPAVVERYRMEALLTIKEEFNGTLYRSDERTLGDGDNLYFVVRFQHPGDDNFYAVAENPVYGNATYVIREDTLPLQPGETALAAVRLSRREVQYFGAKRIIHGTPDLEVHLEKISEHIAKLSEHESVFAH